jgi:hypothetical protein
MVTVFESFFKNYFNFKHKKVVDVYIYDSNHGTPKADAL